MRIGGGRGAPPSAASAPPRRRGSRPTGRDGGTTAAAAASGKKKGGGPDRGRNCRRLRFNQRRLTMPAAAAAGRTAGKRGRRHRTTATRGRGKDVEW
ncbi:hypothetical protein BU14_0230s0019 [Porphyra umbilicalis]|uniref:Uncharacterized protein n=1 Tax=Porphyra umbilicalis TaxID=2786 RepID=A0A1X6P493_PORUM|nr:hypothetical protein BU14_0230s0019 [Porphyra umbilicalis]|eukprot:OSX75596.1 hypothetical protein BU14_0230s0019 [Porphyra umbilicalis]